MDDALNDPALAAIATALRDYPAVRFTTGLRRELERRVQAMATTAPAPAAEQALIPYLVAQDIEPVIAFVKHVFGAQEIHRATGTAGGVHCELRVGDSVVMLGGAVPGSEPVTPKRLGLHVYVDDADAVYARALAAGATSIGPPADAPYGERAGYVKDPAGNHWYIAMHTGPTYFAQEPRTVTPNLQIAASPGRGGAEFIAFAQAAFDAAVDMRHDEGGRLAHAVLRIRGSAVELGETRDPKYSLGAPSMLLLNVADVHAAYEQALNAGATAVRPPARQPWGGTMASVADPWGNEWSLASA
jgi:PhnB protein